MNRWWLHHPLREWRSSPGALQPRLLRPRGDGWLGEMVRDLMSENLEYRFGPTARSAPHRIEWPSAQRPLLHRAQDLRVCMRLGLVTWSTPAYSPESS